MPQCLICKSILNKRNKNFCSKKCASQYKKNISNLISKDELYDLYINKNKSWEELSNYFNCSTATLKKYIEKYDIHYHTKDSPNNSIVIEQVDTKSTRRYWKCRCKCGKEFIISTTAINQRKHLCCNDCLHKKRISSSLIRKTMWNRYIRGAKARNLEFSISVEYAEQLYHNQNGKCALSGVDIIFEPYYKKNKTLTTASLDRIDSSKGYIEGNVQWVHKTVNKLKMGLEEKEFINWCSLISKERSSDA